MCTWCDIAKDATNTPMNTSSAFLTYKAGLKDCLMTSILSDMIGKHSSFGGEMLNNPVLRCDDVERTTAFQVSNSVTSGEYSTTSELQVKVVTRNVDSNTTSDRPLFALENIPQNWKNTYRFKRSDNLFAEREFHVSIRPITSQDRAKATT